MAAHQFTQGATFSNGLVSLPRVDTKFAQLDDFLNPNAQLFGFTGGRGDLGMVMGMQLDYRSFADYTELTGRVESIGQLVYYNYETGLLERSVKLATIVAGSTEALVTATLDADSYTNVGSINGSIDRSPLKVGDMVMTKDEISGYVVGKNGSGLGTQYVIQRRDGVADTLLTSLSAHLSGSVRLITYTMASPEGSRSPDEGVDMPTFRLKNQMQTFRSRDSITGDLDAVGPFEWMGQKKYIDKTRLIQEWRHRMAVNRAMILSPGGTLTIPGSGPGTGLTRLTTGLLPGVRQLGGTFEYDPATGYTGADLDALDAQAKANYSGSSFTLFEGFRHGSAFQKGVTVALGGGIAAIDFSAFGSGDAQKKAIDLGFRSITTPGGITYHRQEADVFNEPEVTGTAGYRYPSLAIFVPGGQQNISVEENGRKVKMQVPSMRIVHTTSSNGDKRRYHTFERGIEQDGVDQRTLETLTQQGIQVVNLRNFSVAQPA